MRGAFGANRRVIFAVSRTCRIATRMCRGAEPTTSACAVDEPTALVRVRRQEVTVTARPPAGAGPSSRLSRRSCCCGRCRRPEPGPGPPGGDRKAGVAGRGHDIESRPRLPHPPPRAVTPCRSPPNLTAMSAGAKKSADTTTVDSSRRLHEAAQEQVHRNPEVEEQSRWRWASRRLGVSRSQTVDPSEGPGHAAGPLSTSSTAPTRANVSDRIAAGRAVATEGTAGHGREHQPWWAPRSLVRPKLTTDSQVGPRAPMDHGGRSTAASEDLRSMIVSCS